jgi:hypothetical protein
MMAGWEISTDGEGGADFLKKIEPYLSNALVDPKNSGSYYYAYRYYQYGFGLCRDNSRNRPFMILAIKSMELEKNKFKERAICDGYDWGTQFDYSIKIIK